MDKYKDTILMVYLRSGAVENMKVFRKTAEVFIEGWKDAVRGGQEIVSISGMSTSFLTAAVEAMVLRPIEEHEWEMLELQNLQVTEKLRVLRESADLHGG